jgi:hypothetical protein
MTFNLLPQTFDLPPKVEFQQGDLETHKIIDVPKITNLKSSFGIKSAFTHLSAPQLPKPGVERIPLYYSILGIKDPPSAGPDRLLA